MKVDNIIQVSSIFVNRDCPRHCYYCSLRDAPLRNRQLSEPEWEKVIRILDSLGVQFHLFLGNEILLMPDVIKFIDFMNNRVKGGFDYALYSTLHPALMRKYKTDLVEHGCYNMSGGIDDLQGFTDKDVKEKSADVFSGLTFFKERGMPDCHGNITITNKNLKQVPMIVKQLTLRGIYSGINVIHWNKDGQYDFFPRKEVLQDSLLSDTKDLNQVIQTLIDGAKDGSLLIHNPIEYLQGIVEYGLDLSWKCKRPHVISIDADGSLRLCSYRPGILLPKFSVMELGNKLPLKKYYQIWEAEAQDCPGCYWPCAWMADFINSKVSCDNIMLFKGHESHNCTKETDNGDKRINSRKSGARTKGG